MLKYTNFKQITVGNLGLEDPPPELYVPIISSFLVGILTDPPPTWQGQCHYNRSFFFLKASLNINFSISECSLFSPFAYLVYKIWLWNNSNIQNIRHTSYEGTVKVLCRVTISLGTNGTSGTYRIFIHCTFSKQLVHQEHLLYAELDSL